MSAERNELPGGPSAHLIRDVRRELRRSLQCRPERRNKIWLLTWQWAWQIADRQSSWPYQQSQRKRWPFAREIATQFILLALTEMRSQCRLRLPFHAEECMPMAVKGFLAENEATFRAIKGPRINRELPKDVLAMEVVAE